MRYIAAVCMPVSRRRRGSLGGCPVHTGLAVRAGGGSSVRAGPAARSAGLWGPLTGAVHATRLAKRNTQIREECERITFSLFK